MTLRMKRNLIVEDDVEKGTVRGQAAVVLDKARLPELVHEETDSGPRGADYLGQRFLADLRKDRLGLVYLPKVGQQQQHPCQPFLAGIKKLIHQILFDPLVAGSSGAISETVVMGTSKGERKETVGYRQRSGVSPRGVRRGSPEDRRAVDEAKMVRDFVFFPVD
jgi:hypothetical protein